MKVTVTNIFKDEQNKEQNINDAFVKIVAAKGLDTSLDPVVSYGKDLQSHDSVANDTEVTDHESEE